MATVINNANPGTPVNEGGSNPNNWLGFVVGLLLVLLVGYLFFVYGLPMLRQASTPTVPNVNVPSEIDVNVNKK